MSPCKAVASMSLSWRKRHRNVPSLPTPCRLPRRYGEVVHAVGKLDHQDYAVKIIRPTKGVSEQQVSREVQALAACASPHVIRYHTAWSEDIDRETSWYIVTEMCDASVRQLEHALASGTWELEYDVVRNHQARIPCLRSDNNTPFKEDTLMDILRQIGTALSHMHSTQYVHLDVKPSNILVKQRKDGSLCFKLADFGKACHVDKEDPPEGDCR